MPVQRVTGGYRWGAKGKVYPTREEAEAQGRAAEASGFQEKTKKKGKRLRIRADLAHGGELHVRHMKDGEQFETLVELASENGTSSAPVWIQIAKRGSFRGHPGGPFTLDDKVFDEIVANFNANENRRVPIDFEHASESDPTKGSIPVEGAPAQGWITQVEKRADGLWGLVEWLPKAREYIRAGQYRYFSPAMRFNSRDRVSGQPVGARLTSGALTNTPFLSGMQQLAAKDAQGNQVSLDEYTERLHALHADIGSALMALGEADDDDIEDETEPADEATQEDTTMADAEKTISLKDHETEVSSLKLQLKDAEAKVSAAEAELKLLKDAEEKRAAAEAEKRIEQAFETYKDSKKLSDADKEAMRVVLSTKPELFEKLYPEVAPQQQPLLKRLSRDRGDPPPADHVVPDMKTLTDKYLKEGKSIEDATSLAFKDVSTFAATH